MDVGLEEIRLPCLAFSLQVCIMLDLAVRALPNKHLSFYMYTPLQNNELEPVYGGFGDEDRDNGEAAKSVHGASLSAIRLYTPYSRTTMDETEAELKRRLLEVFPANSGGERKSGTHLELFNLKDDLVLDGVGDDIHQFHTRHTVASYSQPK